MRTGAANVWSVMSVDAKRNLIFLPTSCPSPDFYGGERRGDNLYSNSVVALHASTGKIAWYFHSGASRCLGLRRTGAAGVDKCSAWSS